MSPRHRLFPFAYSPARALLGLAACLVLAITVAGDPSTLRAQSLDEMSHAACDAYRELEFEKAIKIAEKALQTEKDPGVRVDALKCKTCTHVALRQLGPARDAIAVMLAVDENARFSPDYSYPPPVIDLYHAVRDSLFPGTMDINTIAVGDFEDNSVYTGKFKDYDYSLMGRALVHLINADLSEATPLKVVDRQRTEQMLKEIELGQSGFVNPEQSVKFGQFLGAQSFIFGQYMVLSKDKVRIDARVVHTATGEIVLTKSITGEFGGDPEKFMALEKELILAIAEGIDQVAALSGSGGSNRSLAGAYLDGKSGGAKGRTDYVEAQFLTAQALEYEDAGNYDAAQKVWAKVRDLDPANETASVRLEVLDIFAMNAD